MFLHFFINLLFDQLIKSWATLKWIVEVGWICESDFQIPQNIGSFRVKVFVNHLWWHWKTHCTILQAFAPIVHHKMKTGKEALTISNCELRIAESATSPFRCSVFGVRGHVRALVRRDMSRREKRRPVAAVQMRLSCRRTPEIAFRFSGVKSLCHRRRQVKIFLRVCASLRFNNRPCILCDA